MTTTETPLNLAGIRCRNCEQVVKDWDDWFGGPCTSDQATGHSLDWSEIMLLRFRTKAKT